MPTDDERREIAARLRKCTLPTNYSQTQGGGWSHLCDMALAVGLKQEDRPTAWDLAQRLAELIDPGEDVSVSAYDLLPEEDREALRWVRGHGGLDKVRRDFQDAYNRRVELCSALGIDLETGWSDAMAEMMRRLMPEGMGWDGSGLEILKNWPRYEDGEPVRICDKIEDIEVRSIVFNEGGILLSDCTSVPGWGTWRSYKERVRRPAVLAADGEPLEVGQTVWHVGNGVEFTVIGLPNPGEYQAVKLRLDDGASTGLDPDQLTHQRPVLDVDGVPINVGDRVWNIAGGGPYEIIRVNAENAEYTYNDNCGPMDWGASPKELTHKDPYTKPEPPDTWGLIWTSVTTGTTTLHEFERRCKALAEKENGNE